MTRDVEALTRRRFDLLVIGGGIHGLFAAYDGAQRGLSVALVEASDFGSGLSFNHQRTIHGGLRALQHGHVRKTRQQLEERRAWARIAPHLIRPLPFLIGTYGWTTRSRWALRAGFRLYDFIGRKRNAGVPQELHLPHARLESAATTRRLFPGVADIGLTGGAMWYDYQTRHPDRLTGVVALAAIRAGAELVNYVRAIGPLKNGTGRVTGARVHDVMTGREHEVEAAVTLVAAGGGLGELLEAFGARGGPPLLRAMNLLLNRPARDIATAAPAPSGRMLTAVPWRGHVLVGTHQSDVCVQAPETSPPSEAVDAFLRDANAAFPNLHVTRGDIRFIHHGLTPAMMRGGRADLMPEPTLTRHAQQGVAGLVSLVGVKYTTARWAAERAVNAVCETLGRPRGRCRTGHAALPHAGIADVEGRLTETQRELGLDLERDVLEHLASWYGTEAPDVLRYSAQVNLVDRIGQATPVLSGEIAYGVEHRAVVRLSDAVLRRTPLGSTGYPGRDALERAAAIVGDKLGWTLDRATEEMTLVEQVYPHLGLG